MEFRRFFETTDIFGFDKPSEEDGDQSLDKPIHQFNVELMMDYLLHKKIGNYEPYSLFVNEMRWGNQPGCIKLEVDTGYTFYIKKLASDKQGNPRWVTKRMFQLNRQGYGGLEDVVAQEVHNHMVKISESNIDAPIEGFSDDEMENLVHHLYTKIKRHMKGIFIPMGIKKLGEYAYIISMELRGHGVEAPGQQRIEQNQTAITYDKNQGTIRIFNYNIESPVGGAHEWSLMENDLDIYFFPSQDMDEIAECLAVHFKYY